MKLIKNIPFLDDQRENMTDEKLKESLYILREHIDIDGNLIKVINTIDKAELSVRKEIIEKVDINKVIKVLLDMTISLARIVNEKKSHITNVTEIAQIEAENRVFNTAVDLSLMYKETGDGSKDNAMQQYMASLPNDVEGTSLKLY